MLIWSICHLFFDNDPTYDSLDKALLNFLKYYLVYFCRYGEPQGFLHDLYIHTYYIA